MTLPGHETYSNVVACKWCLLVLMHCRVFQRRHDCDCLTCCSHQNCGRQVTKSLSQCRNAGADIIGDDAFIQRIQQEGSSALDFDACLGTRAMMPAVTRIARILGPRGLMPNPKLGTLVEPGGMQAALGDMKKGRVQYRCMHS